VAERSDDTSSKEAFLAGGAQEWCQAVLDDIEFAMRERFGTKWSPEAQVLFDSLRDTCITQACLVDSGVKRTAIAPLRAAVVLTNYGAKGR